MKEYNAKIIVNNDELKIMYECDREKNKDCKGYGNCGPCNHTTDTRKIKARKANKMGIDLGQEKEYTVMRTYYNGELASEEKIQYK